MSLQAILSTIETDLRNNSPIHVMQSMDRMISQLQQLGVATGVAVGEQAPDFTLPNAIGEAVTLSDLLRSGPVVLQFYRGGWCPFCSRQLRAYQDILADIHDIGGQLVAISPQLPDHTLSTKEKNELQFEVVSDRNALVAADYNVSFPVPSEVAAIYEQDGEPIAHFNGGANVLTVPATYMIDEANVIRFAYVNANFMQRLEPNELLKALRHL